MKASRRPGAIVGAGSVWDGIAYWATIVGVYLVSLLLPNRPDRWLRLGDE